MIFISTTFGQASTKYTNARGFSSYFLEFDTGCRLELMQWQEVTELKNEPQRQFIGLGHPALCAGYCEAVDALIQRLGQNRWLYAAERTSHHGDGYYESCLLDPELNRIELSR